MFTVWEIVLEVAFLKLVSELVKGAVIECATAVVKAYVQEGMLPSVLTLNVQLGIAAGPSV